MKQCFPVSGRSQLHLVTWSLSDLFASKHTRFMQAYPVNLLMARSLAP